MPEDFLRKESKVDAMIIVNSEAIDHYFEKQWPDTKKTRSSSLSSYGGRVMGREKGENMGINHGISEGRTGSAKKGTTALLN